MWSELENFEFKPVSGAWASPPEPQQGPVQGQTTSGALLRPAAGTDGPHGCRMPPTALTGTYGTARDMPLPMPHPRQPAPAGTAGAEWAVCCCCVRVVTTAVDHASTTDGTDALGIVGRVVIGWSGHERAARAAFCRQDDMNTNEKAGSTTGWTTLLLDLTDDGPGLRTPVRKPMRWQIPMGFSLEFEACRQLPQIGIGNTSPALPALLGRGFALFLGKCH